MGIQKEESVGKIKNKHQSLAIRYRPKTFDDVV